jgi:predicted acylesterase/phospholipase RssA
MLKFVLHKIFQLKRIFLAVTAIILSATTVIHPFSSTGIKDSTPPNFALVLSGGGARGLAQIGVLLALEHAGLKPDLIVGTSIGALIGGLFSAGYSPDSIKTMAHTIRWEDIANNDVNRHSKFVSQKTEPLNHIIEFRFTKKFKPILPSQSYGQYFYEVLTPKFALPQIKSKGNFDSLKIPLRVIATDLLTGKKYVFSKGNIATSIRASCSIPLIFSPVEYEGHLFIDGGISSNIPVECAIDNNAKHIVAVDVTAPLWNKVDLDNPVKMVDQVIAIGVTRQKNYEKSLADILICPNLNNFSNTDYRNIDTLISIGYYATLEKIDSIKLLIAPEKQLLESVHDQNGQDSSDTSSISETSKGTVTHYQHNNSQIHDTTIFQPGIVKDVLITGNIGTYPRIIKTAAGIKAGDTLSPLLLEKSLSSLYATDLFELINTEIDSDFTVKISVKEKMHWRTRIGLRYDNFHLAEGT